MYDFYIMLLFIFISNFFIPIICSFLDLKKISENEDYFVLLDNGLYIYNFENSKCHNIKELDSSQLLNNNENNFISISNIYKNEEETKIAALINQHLYVYSYNDSYTKVEILDIESLVNNDQTIFPFNFRIENFQLIINLIKYEKKNLLMKHFVRSFDFGNYLFINNNEPKIVKYDDDYTNKPICQFDDFNSLIKCVYVHAGNTYLNFFKIQKSEDCYKNVDDEISIEKKLLSDYKMITLTFCQNKDFVCFSRNNEIRCYFKKKSEEEFSRISYDFENQCSELKTFYFDKTNKFLLSCRREDGYKLYIFDESNMNNISEKSFIIGNYNGKSSIIYNNKINNYDIIYDGNFTIPCNQYNKEELSIDTTSKLPEMKVTPEIKLIKSTYLEKNNQIESTTFFNFHSSDITTEKFNKTNISKSYFYDNEEKSNELETEYRKIDEYILENEIIKTNTSRSKEEIIGNISFIINDKEIGKNYEIKGDDFTIIIKPTNSNYFENSTYVEFYECEKILREKYNISNSSIITFFQMEINNNDANALYNQIKYFTYDDKKQELDLSLCEDIETKIHYNMKGDSNLDISTINDFKDKGVDIFNIEDDFFTDICHPYSDSKNDMILEDRIKYIYQNYTLCEEGCSYNNIDLDKMSITCDCKIQGNFSSIISPLIFDQANDASFFDSNIGVAKCYNLVFSMNNKFKNLGFIIFTILILIYLICFLIFLCKGIKPVSNFVLNEMVKFGYLKENKEKVSQSITKIKASKLIKKTKTNKNSNPSKKFKFKAKKGNKMVNKDERKKIINMNFIANTENFNKKKNNKNRILNNKLSNSSVMKNKTLNSKIKNGQEIDNFGIIKINISENKIKYFPKDSNQTLHNYTFNEAIKYDRRNIFRIFYIYLLSKQIIFHTFFQKSPLELFTLRFSLFIFIFSSDLALNSLFYLNDNISKKYHYAKNLFLFAFSNNLTIIIYSTLVSYFLITIMTKLTHSSNSIRNIFGKEEQKMKSKKNYIINEKRKKEIHSEILTIFKKYKIKLFFLFFIQIILIIFFWYFVTAFCHVYSSTQSSW